MQVLVYMHIQRSEGNSYHVTAEIGAQFNDLVSSTFTCRYCEVYCLQKTQPAATELSSTSSVARELKMNRSFHLVNEQGDWEALVFQI